MVGDWIEQNPLQSTANQHQQLIDVKRESESTEVNSYPISTNLAYALAQQMSLSRLPPPEPSVFFGDPLAYQGWKSAFQTLIEVKGIPRVERIYYLKKYLGGEARETVDGYFLISSDAAYDDAKALLDRRYGDPFIIANAFRSKLEAWPKIPPRDGTALRKYSDFLRQCCAAQHSIRCLNVLNDEHENRKMLLKLPDWIVTRWARIAADWRVKQRVYPPFEEFVGFIAQEADIACDPVTSLQSLKVIKQLDAESPRQEPKRRIASSSFSTRTQESAASVSSAARDICQLCGKNHDIDRCRDFLSKALTERKEFAISRKLCFGCLQLGHRSKSCKQRKTCDVCSKRHPTSLHGDQRPTPLAPETTRKQFTQGTTNVCHLASSTKGSKCSMVLPVWVSHKDNPECERLVYALLDTQSDTTFILDDTYCSLGVDGPAVNLFLSTMFSEDQIVSSRRIDGLVVRGYDSDVKISLPPSYSREIMPANRSHIPTPDIARQWTHLIGIADHLMPLQNIEVGLLIGYNCPRALAPRDVIPPVSNEPFGQRTDLGWGIVGIVDASNDEYSDDPIGTSHRILVTERSSAWMGTKKHQSLGVFACRTAIKEAIDPSTITRMMEQDFNERPSSVVPSSYEDRIFLRKVGNGIRLDEDSHYEMPLPFKEPRPVLPDNKAMATHRLRSLKRRLQKDANYCKDYVEFMQNIIKSGYAEEVAPANTGETVWFIPHHGVYHPKKPNKIRVVFDCSAKCNGLSLNDLLLQGPDLTNTLAGVLCRFRLESVAFMCDIEQMFFQFRVTEEHRDFLRFLWWPEGDFNQEPKEFRMKVHLFGAASSPGCANFGLKHTANENESDCGTDAADFVRKDFYVDDGLKSVPTVQEAISLINRSTELCKKGGLRLHKFISNSKKVIESINV